MTEGDVYRSHYSGAEIDRLLGLVESALQPGALTPYLARALAEELFVSKQDGKGLSSNDFTTSLMEKLSNLPTMSQLEETLDNICNYRILPYTTSKATTRLQVTSRQRRYGLIISYNMNGEHITEKYISSNITNTEWVKNSNWTNLSVREKPKRPVTEGVYILDVNGYYTPYKQWNVASNAQSVGVAIIDIRASFMIAPTDIAACIWSDISSLVPGIVASYDLNQLNKDYFGQENTRLIIEAQGSRAAAAYNCDGYRFRNNKEGHLPGYGEWWIAYLRRNEVNEALQMIGDAIPDYKDYWTSSQCPSGHAWYFGWWNAQHDCTNKNIIKQVRPFGELPEES